MQRQRALFLAAISVLLVSCASYSGRGLRMGQDTEEQVLQLMGQPALRWQDADGSKQLAYPRGPAGFHSYMVLIGADGKLQRIDNVLGNPSFARIGAGMSKAQVLRVLGPPVPGWTIYFKARDELVWEWRYCDDWNQPARFDVLFDGKTATVRSTMSQTEDQMGLCGLCGLCGREGGCLCAK